MAMPTGQASPCQGCVDGASRFCATIHSTGCSMCSCSPGPSPLLPSQPLLPPTPVACLTAAAPPPPHRAWTHRSPPAANSLDVIYGVTIFSALLSLLGSLFIIVTYHSIYGSRLAAQLCAAHVARLTRRRTLMRPLRYRACPHPGPSLSQFPRAMAGLAVLRSCRRRRRPGARLDRDSVLDEFL